MYACLMVFEKDPGEALVGDWEMPGADAVVRGMPLRTGFGIRCPQTKGPVLRPTLLSATCGLTRSVRWGF